MNSEPTSKIRGRKIIRKKLPPIEFLKECFEYFPETGSVLWKRRPRDHFTTDNVFGTINTRFSGKEAGSRSYEKDGKKSHVEVNLFWKGNSKTETYTLTHIIFALMGIEIPDGIEVDHKDRNPWNNSWSNLRMGTGQQNNFNRIIPSNSKLPKGVFRNGSGYTARIGIGYKRKCLGTFNSPEAAHAAYCSAANNLHGEFACH